MKEKTPIAKLSKKEKFVGLKRIVKKRVKKSVNKKK